MNALDSLLYFVKSSFRISQLLSQCRSQIANNLLDLTPDLVVYSLLL
jgi:hypothetical protein